MSGEASTENPFHLQPDKPGFEALSKTNGFRFWWASELAVTLGYESLNSFRKAVERAMIALTSLNIPVFDNILQEQREVGGKMIVDYRLSRFACYLAAMNGDPRKPQVAQAQAYFVQWAEACRLYLEQADGVERVAIRGEISEHERTLSGTAKSAGVVDYGLFQNAGYRGLYNMDLWQVRRRKGVPQGRSPLDFMAKTELAANLFRVTQTEEKIRGTRIRGQSALERTAEDVGRKVRRTMVEISGKRPEDLPPDEDIKEVHKKLKSTHREIRKLDRPKVVERTLPKALALNRSAAHPLGAFLTFSRNWPRRCSALQSDSAPHGAKTILEILSPVQSGRKTSLRSLAADSLRQEFLDSPYRFHKSVPSDLAALQRPLQTDPGPDAHRDAVSVALSIS